MMLIVYCIYNKVGAPARVFNFYSLLNRNAKSNQSPSLLGHAVVTLFIDLLP